jgi:hypothetical protein
LIVRTQWGALPAGKLRQDAGPFAPDAAGRVLREVRIPKRARREPQRVTIGVGQPATVEGAEAAASREPAAVAA